MNAKSLEPALSTPINLEVKMTNQLQFRFLMANTWQTRNGKVKWIISILAIPLLGVYLIDGAINTSSILLMIILGLNFIVQPIALYLIAGWQITHEKKFQNILKYSIFPEGICYRQDGTNVTDWSKFFWIMQTNALFLFYTSYNQAIIIPKNLLSDDEIKAIRGFVLKHKKDIKKCNINKI